MNRETMRVQKKKAGKRALSVGATEMIFSFSSRYSQSWLQNYKEETSEDSSANWTRYIQTALKF